MIRANEAVLKQFDDLAEQRKREILDARDEITIKGTTYYVSNAGDDENDGKTPETAWKTLAKVSETPLCVGDGVRFRRAAHRMLHLVAKKAESCPVMYNNTYIQSFGMTLGQYGANEITEPANESFDEYAEEKIAKIFHDKDAKVYAIG